jgi:hypothetical protein
VAFQCVLGERQLYVFLFFVIVVADGIVVAVVVCDVAGSMEDCEIRSWEFVFETCHNLGRHEPGIGVKRLVVDLPSTNLVPALLSK